MTITALWTLLCLGLTASAKPVAAGSTAGLVARQDSTFVGTFTNEDGEPYELWDSRTGQHDDDATSAFAAHMKRGSDNEATFEKRDWWNCQNPNNNVKTGCCHTDHAIGGYLKTVGLTTFHTLTTNKDRPQRRSPHHRGPNQLCPRRRPYRLKASQHLPRL